LEEEGQQVFIQHSGTWHLDFHRGVAQTTHLLRDVEDLSLNLVEGGLRGRQRFVEEIEREDGKERGGVLGVEESWLEPFSQFSLRSGPDGGRRQKWQLIPQEDFRAAITVLPPQLLLEFLFFVDFQEHRESPALQRRGPLVPFETVLAAALRGGLVRVHEAGRGRVGEVADLPSPGQRRVLVAGVEAAAVQVPGRSRGHDLEGGVPAEARGLGESLELVEPQGHAAVEIVKTIGQGVRNQPTSGLTIGSGHRHPSPHGWNNGAAGRRNEANNLPRRLLFFLKSYR